MPEQVTNFELLLTRGRALGISFLIAEQVISEICRAARISPHLLVSFTVTGTEFRTVLELLGLREREQVEMLGSLGKGECIVVLTGDRCPVPLHVRIPDPAVDRSNLNAKEREFYERRSLRDQLPNVKPRFVGFAEVKKRESDPSRLSMNAWRVFVRIVGYPPETIMERCVSLGLNRNEEKTARDEARAKGYLKPAGTFGRGIKFFSPTAKGIDFANKNNVPVRKFKSGVVHEYLLHHVKASLGRSCPGLKWKKPAGATGSVQPDAYGLFADGTAMCVEISVKNKPTYEVKRLLQLCSIDHIDIVVVVAPTDKGATALESVFSAEWEPGVPKRYRVVSATRCLESDCDWMPTLESHR